MKLVLRAFCVRALSDATGALIVVLCTLALVP